MESNPERDRIVAEERRTEHWLHWGPYLADRQWGTVREDYSPDGNAWSAFPFEHARSRAYRWGEDGIFGLSDDHQRLCFAPAFWNGRDPFLKERFFGLSNPEGNHGEDAKEYWYHLDNVPSHAYMKGLYKYPQRAFPYRELIETNARRSRLDPEYELIDTGIFDDDAYFDIEVEYAKRGQHDILARITATNRGPAAAPLYVIPQIWFRNEWSWQTGTEKPALCLDPETQSALLAHHATLGTYRFAFAGNAELLFTENETNVAEVFGATNPQPYVKDGIDRFIVRDEKDAVNPLLHGTKAALSYAFVLPPGASETVRLRLREATDNVRDEAPFDGTFEETFERRHAEANRFYALLGPAAQSPEAGDVRRKAFAGMLWSKQFYNYVVRDWLHGDPAMPPPPAERIAGRNHGWIHLYANDVLSMPDSWEYPWFAAWDLAFHCVALAEIDPAFAKQQLLVLTREWYMHPNGELPAYEWAFGDVNPPVHAWAAYRVFQIERDRYGTQDDLFLERVFQKLLLNFTWWVNREDPSGNNVFAGGFLGLDNIGAFDRNAVLPAGGHLDQSDATSWMAVYALDMLGIALELAQNKPAYEDIASKFFEHFLYIAHAINNAEGGESGLWDEGDGFYYDGLALPDGTHTALRVRSLVGLLPLLAVRALPPDVLTRLPAFAKRMQWFIDNRPELKRNVACMETLGRDARRLLSIIDRERLGRVLGFMLDEAEFLSAYGIRSLSKFHEAHPYAIDLGGKQFQVGYEPAESHDGTFGGNSNWRGPVWFPINLLLVEALQEFHAYYGDDFRVECPVGSGRERTLGEIADELARRLLSLFLPDSAGRRPFNGGVLKFQEDAQFRDQLLYYEYFHADNGAGLGASHQTGWTGLVAKLVQQLAGCKP